MRITVFTPAYNRGDCLPQLYGSLKEQTFKDFEWIIVDDGSTDNTEEICQSWLSEKEFSIRYLFQENSGKHVAVNLGAKEACGEFFFIVDSDDYLLPDSLEAINNYLNDIEMNDKFAGVAGLRGKKDGTVWTSYYMSSATAHKGMKELDREYIDATSFAYRYKLGIQGDRAEVVRTEILRRHSFPVFEHEKFLSEGVLWSKLAEEGYLFRWFNKVIYITEYRNDGLSQNIKKVHDNSPKGVSYYCNFMCAQKAIPLKNRFLNKYNYFRYGIKAGYSKRELMRRCRWKGMTFTCLLLAVVRPD